MTVCVGVPDSVNGRGARHSLSLGLARSNREPRAARGGYRSPRGGTRSAPRGVEPTPQQSGRHALAKCRDCGEVFVYLRTGSPRLLCDECRRESDRRRKREEFVRRRRRESFYDIEKAIKNAKDGQVIALGKNIAANGADRIKVDGSKAITIDSKTGKVTVKRGLKKGTYKVSVKVNAAGNSNYDKSFKTGTFTVKVI